MSNTGNGIKARPGEWSFGGDVPNFFNEHIERSVPGYKEGHELITKLAPFFLSKKESKFFEVGCSTGSLTFNVAKILDRLDITYTGIDVEEKMIEYCTKNNNFENCIFDVGDVLNYEIFEQNLIASYYTIQFINPSVRQSVINKIYESLQWGSAFIMFEKVRGPDARFQDIMDTLYTEYKMENGYNEKEIISKKLSLKGILEPFSSNANIEMLKRAGFEDIQIIFKRLSFEGFLAIK